MNQRETDQFLPREDLPAAKMDALSFWACVFFPNIQDLLSLGSPELISWPRVNAACYVSKLCPYDSFSTFIDLFRFSTVCVCVLLSSLIYDIAFICNVKGMCACLHEHSHPCNDVCFSWLEQDVCTNTSLRFVRAISLWRANCG